MAELILVGGGHAHLMTISEIERLRRAGHRVTVIQPDIRKRLTNSTLRCGLIRS